VGLSGADRTVLLLLGVAPTPFFVVAFATVENLDVRLTVNIVSVSMLMSLPLALGVRRRPEYRSRDDLRRVPTRRRSQLGHQQSYIRRSTAPLNSQ